MKFTQSISKIRKDSLIQRKIYIKLHFYDKIMENSNFAFVITVTAFIFLW